MTQGHICRMYASGARGILGASPRRFAITRRLQICTRATAGSMVAVGDQVPSDIPMFVFEGGKPKRTTTGDLFGSKKVAIVGIPGAFTPTCSTKHLPSFVEKAEEIKSMGFDEIACVAVNDAFVLSKWGQELDPDGKIHMVADGTTEFSKKLGLDVDAAEAGMCGVRLKRSAMVLEHLKVNWIGTEEEGGVMADDLIAGSKR